MVVLMILRGGKATGVWYWPLSSAYAEVTNASRQPCTFPTCLQGVYWGNLPYWNY